MTSFVIGPPKNRHNFHIHENNKTSSTKKIYNPKLICIQNETFTNYLDELSSIIFPSKISTHFTRIIQNLFFFYRTTFLSRLIICHESTLIIFASQLLNLMK